MVKLLKMSRGWIWLVSVIWASLGAGLATNSWANSAPSFYKIEVKNINLPPIKPLSVLGLNTFIVQGADQKFYFVTLFAQLKSYKWQIDVLSLKKTTTLEASNYNLIGNVPINVYLSENVNLVARVSPILSSDEKVVTTAGDTQRLSWQDSKHLALLEQQQDLRLRNTSKGDEHNSASASAGSILRADANNVVELPYFIAAANKFSQRILPIAVGKMRVALDQSNPGSIHKNFQLRFNQKYLDTFQILAGWKLSQAQYTQLVNYISYSSAHMDLFT